MPDDPDDDARPALDRRIFLQLAAGTAALGALPLAGCKKNETNVAPTDAPSAIATTSAAANPGVVRIVSVPTAVEGNLLPTLIADFERDAKLRVELTATDDVYGLARAGKADLAVSHYGHKHAEAFVMEGFGEWPRTIFSNQMALVGPPADPAKIRGLLDAGEAFRRIAATKSPFVLNGIDGVRYLVEILWNAAGRPDRAGWFFDEGKRKEAALTEASERGAYAFWGLTPFLRMDHTSHLKLEPLVLGDPLLQRMLVSIVIKGSKVSGVNVDGANALQAHLLSPVTQARIREVRYPGAQSVAWVPGGRHNRTAILPKG